MKRRAATEWVDSVLEYFNRYITFSQLERDLQAVWHWQECWCLVFTHFFGSWSPRRRTTQPSIPGTGDVTPHPRPRWFVEKYSRPVRKVIDQRTERIGNAGAREYFSIHFDVLECGHSVESHLREHGQPPAQRRWCPECPAKNQQMREAGMTGSARSLGNHEATPAFAVARADNPIIRARREPLEVA